MPFDAVNGAPGDGVGRLVMAFFGGEGVEDVQAIEPATPPEEKGDDSIFGACGELEVGEVAEAFTFGGDDFAFQQVADIDMGC